ALINDKLEAAGTTPLRQGVKLIDLVLRPQLDMTLLQEMVNPLKEFIEQNIEEERRQEIVEAAEIMMKYQGYIEREQLVAEKLHRLENIKLGDKFDYDNIKALSTEARQKLTRLKPQTIAQASRIPGISPSDINILLLMLGR
ncbi:MAG: tRNA uridine-5-carboxymethylaminomethyl(34) synthesis enzyme MnmG, partial [Muribaculaceae bacterium]|nr:tRNA uridine-5-carboxymethylaminomethyl(34) synthesis enzyme MnmG [Muribaculaceae bacterium]